MGPPTWIEKKVGSAGWNPTLEAAKAPVKFVVTGPGRGKIGQTLTMKVRVTRTTDGGPAQGVTVQPHGATTLTTNDAGEVAFQYPVGCAGLRTIEVKTAEGPRYLAGQVSTTIQISPKDN